MPFHRLGPLPKALSGTSPFIVRLCFYWYDPWHYSLGPTLAEHYEQYANWSDAHMSLGTMLKLLGAQPSNTPMPQSWMQRPAETSLPLFLHDLGVRLGFNLCLGLFLDLLSLQHSFEDLV